MDFGSLEAALTTTAGVALQIALAGEGRAGSWSSWYDQWRSFRSSFTKKPKTQISSEV
jgi:hypothetical protein